MQDTRSPKQSCLVQKKLIPKRVFLTKYFLNDICEKKSKVSMKVEKKVAARWSKKDETWMKDATDPPTIWSLLFIFVFLCWSSQIQRNIVQRCATYAQEYKWEKVKLPAFERPTCLLWHAFAGFCCRCESRFDGLCHVRCIFIDWIKTGSCKQVWNTWQTCQNRPTIGLAESSVWRFGIGPV